MPVQSLHLLTHPDVLFHKHNQIGYVTWLSATLGGLNVFQIRIKGTGSDSNCCLSKPGPRSHETYHCCFWCLTGTCLGCMFSAVSCLCLPVCCLAVRQICNDTRYRRWKSAQVGLITPILLLWRPSTSKLNHFLCFHIPYLYNYKEHIVIWTGQVLPQ